MKELNNKNAKILKVKPQILMIIPIIIFMLFNSILKITESLEIKKQLNAHNFQLTRKSTLKNNLRLISLNLNIKKSPVNANSKDSALILFTFTVIPKEVNLKEINEVIFLGMPRPNEIRELITKGISFSINFKAKDIYKLQFFPIIYDRDNHSFIEIKNAYGGSFINPKFNFDNSKIKNFLAFEITQKEKDPNTYKRFKEEQNSLIKKIKNGTCSICQLKNF